MKRFAKAIAFFSAGSLVGTLTQVAKGKLGAVLLGTDGVGVLSQLTNAWNLLYSISGLGFYNGIVRRVAEIKDRNDEAGLARQLSTSLILLTLFSCVTAGVCAVLSQSISHWIFSDGGERAWLLAIMTLSVPLAITAQTYKGMLSGHRLVKPIVNAQVISDVLGLIAFAILILSFNLLGAVIAFGLLQFLKLVFQIYYVKRSFPLSKTAFSLADFDWHEVRVNIGYGINGLVLKSLAVVTILLATRFIIGAEGLAAAGIFAVAWKVSSVYFGAIYASTANYYFPTLVSSVGRDGLRSDVNDAISLLFYVLPPVVIALMIAGDLLMQLLFSHEFLPAAVLLVFLLLGDAGRILAELIGMSFLARNKLQPYTLSYLAWAAIFILLTLVLLPKMGLVGVAVAYLISQFVNALVVFLCARNLFGFSFQPRAARALAYGIVAMAMAAVTALLSTSWPIRYLLGAGILLAWLAASWTDPMFRSLAHAGFGKIKRILGVSG